MISLVIFPSDKIGAFYSTMHTQKRVRSKARAEVHASGEKDDMDRHEDRSKAWKQSRKGTWLRMKGPDGTEQQDQEP